MHIKKIILIIGMLLIAPHYLSAAPAPHTASVTDSRQKIKHRALQHKRVAHKLKKKPAVKQATSLSQAALTHSNQVIEAMSTPSFASSIEKRLLGFVRSSIATLHYSAYKLGGTRFDSSKGIYVVDCSSYVDHILKAVYPRAYSNLASWSGSEKPTTHDYYDYFSNLSYKPQRYWNTVEEVEKLRPGDILVFRAKNKFGNDISGHVMVVMDKPIQDDDIFLIRVTDSAPSGHSGDTRLPHVSGIGIGTLLLKVDPKTYQPFAYAWKVGSHWKTNVEIAMGRPVDNSLV